VTTQYLDSVAKILFVVTATSYWTLKDGTRHPTGYWAEEFAAPYDALSRAGHEIVVATPGGTVPYVDAMSLRPSMAGSAEIAEQLEGILRSAQELRRPIQLANARLDDYDAVYYPGGHGPMEDLWQDADSGRLLIAALASGKPAGDRLPRTGRHPGHPLRRRISLRGLSGHCVHQRRRGRGRTPRKAPWTAEDELVKLGVDFVRDEMWKPFTVVDRNLYTGQNPASAGPLAEEVLKVLSR
jgi:putative intracellular protease/amidase